MKLALIAFDGLDPRVIYNQRDKLPAFDRLLDDSMHGKWSTPGHTIPSFTATLTGKQYNQTDFHWDDGGQYKRHRQTDFKFLWDVCSCDMTLLNIPTLYPPEDIEDAMVCGFLTPDDLVRDNLARPMEVQVKLNSMNYIHDINADDTYNELGGEKMLELLTEMANRRVQAAKWLVEKYDSDLFYGVWTGTDRWFHQCVMHGEDHMKMYQVADTVLNKMMAYLPEDVPKVVFSDHGFAHYKRDDGVHKGHMYEGFYAIQKEDMPSHRDDSNSIFDLFPTVVNYLDCEVTDEYKGRILFHTDDENQQVLDRLGELGYLE